MLYFEARDLVKEVFVSRSSLKNLTSVLIATFGLILMCQLIKGIIANLDLQAVCAVTCSVLVYGLILIFFKNEVIVTNLKSVKRKLLK